MMKQWMVGSLLWLLAAVPVVVQAQVKFGVTAGMNVSKLSFDKSKLMDSDNRYGWYIGPKVVVQVPVIGLGVDASVQYSQRRLNASMTEEGNVYSKSNNLQTLEIPINVRKTFGLGSIAGIYIATGPQFGFNIGNKKLEDYAELKKANVTWNIGAGVRLLDHLEAGAGYNIALSNFGKSFSGENGNDFKSNSWQVQLAYYF